MDGASAAAGGAAAAAAMAQAIKASGAIIRVEPGEFQKILHRQDSPLVVEAIGGFRGRTRQYLTSYKGLVFHTKTTDRVIMPSRAEVVLAKKIWIPA